MGDTDVGIDALTPLRWGGDVALVLMGIIWIEFNSGQRKQDVYAKHAPAMRCVRQVACFL
jgi:hypothetical protein